MARGRKLTRRAKRGTRKGSRKGSRRQRGGQAVMAPAAANAMAPAAATMAPAAAKSVNIYFSYANNTSGVQNVKSSDNTIVDGTKIATGTQGSISFSVNGGDKMTLKDWSMSAYDGTKWNSVNVMKNSRARPGVGQANVPKRDSTVTWPNFKVINLSPNAIQSLMGAQNAQSTNDKKGHNCMITLMFN
jgi:hypothetical protein